ncbi:BMP family lipoprotein [Vibrio mediterranei]|uniref:BMP family lipoprotein n=1 Tax=Vibrio mediterranei TaxID=689 RepID=UPI0022834FE1|nr:BMP family ABC transporter substrate-binding protein [Vibrio mediterranei]MCY9855968.1 BMP family ABC transporter substrate-binding protein [Vibrio mediterranei]
MFKLNAYTKLIGGAALAWCISSGAMAKDFSAVYFVHGTLGDKSFMDSAQRGMDIVKKSLGVKTKTVEAGLDSTQWESSFRDIVEFENYDVYIAVTYPMAAIVQELAQEYPEKKFILVDATVNYDECSNKCDNVYSLLFKQNEASYLAGAYAAEMTKSSLMNNKSKVVGIVGGQEVPVIKDFVVGFEQGAKEIEPDTKILVQYANSWTDPAKGKEMAKALYGQGADIVFSVAGGTGQGVFEAAAESNKYAIGVDADQSQLLQESNPKQASLILTSVLKNVDAGLSLALSKAYEGQLQYGISEYVGVKEGAVGLAKNKVYKQVTPKYIQVKIDAIENNIINGKIKINSAFKH